MGGVTRRFRPDEATPNSFNTDAEIAMRNRFELDDGSVVEPLSTEVDGREYSGTFRIRKVGAEKVQFQVEYLDHYHEDRSLFKPTAVSQMRIHAKFVLRDLVRKSLESSNARKDAAAKE